MRRDLLQISNQTLDHELDTGEHYEAAFSSRKISKALTGQNGWDIMNTRFTVQYSNKPTLTPVIILFQAKNWTNDLPASELETAFSEMIRVAKQFPDEYYPGRCCGSLRFSYRRSSFHFVETGGETNPILARSWEVGCLLC